MDAANDAGKSIHVKFDRALAERLEDWRRRQPQIPTIAEGVRRLVDRAIANEHVSA